MNQGGSGANVTITNSVTVFIKKLFSRWTNPDIVNLQQASPDDCNSYAAAVSVSNRDLNGNVNHGTSPLTPLPQHWSIGEKRHALGEPVCCCESCSALADRPGLEMSCSAADIRMSTSLPTHSQHPSMIQQSACIYRTPANCSQWPTAKAAQSCMELKFGCSTLKEDVLHVSSSGLAHSCSDQLHSQQSCDLAHSLPPSIQHSPDGEEGFAIYQQSLAVCNLFMRADPYPGRAPPNVTIRHLTDEDR